MKMLKNYFFNVNKMKNEKRKEGKMIQVKRDDFDESLEDIIQSVTEMLNKKEYEEEEKEKKKGFLK